MYTLFILPFEHTKVIYNCHVSLLVNSQKRQDVWNYTFFFLIGSI